MVLLQLGVLVSVCFGRVHGQAVDLVSAAVASGSMRCEKETAQRIDCYPPSVNFPGPTEELCLAQGCCWKSLENEGVPCAFAAEEPPAAAKCEKVAKPSRLACRNPRFSSSKGLADANACESAGCCFDNGDCFQPSTDGYELLTLDETSTGWRGTLALRRGDRGPFGSDVPLLELNVIRESARQVRIRITDPAFPRYEVPDLPVRRQKEEEDDREKERDLEVHFTPWPFGVAVTRRSSREVLFNSTPPEDNETFSGLIFENQFLELSTQLTSGEDDDEPVLYGLGERLGKARLRADDGGDLYPMFARAPNTSNPVHTRSGGDNLYGVHPFVMQLEGSGSGNAHGLFVLSSNAMEVVARTNALTYRLTGGVLDVFIFSGPTPQDVIEQYTDIVGRPAMPPYWALGYHVGRHGEETSIEDAVEVVTQLRVAGIPMEAYWQDYEYMKDNGQALSLDERKFPHRDMRAFIDDLHFHSQYFVCVQVPTITLTNTSTSGRHGEDIARYSAVRNLKQVNLALHTHDGRSDDEDVESGRHEKNGNNDDNIDAPCIETADQSRSNQGDSANHDTHSDSDFQSASDRGDASNDEKGDVAWDPIARGEELDVFVKGVNGERYAEKAFRSGWAVFVDFFHPEALHYWHEQLAMFHKYVVPFDGVWLDRNEPSSVCDCTLAAEGDICARVCREDDQTRGVLPHENGAVRLKAFEGGGDGGFIRTNDVNFPFDPYRQPFVPGQNDPSRGGHGNLNSATLPMAALHHSSLHYNLHSLYGHEHARATRHALDSIVKKRSVLLSRSTFSGSGRYAGHWLGDNAETSWEQLRLSISGTLQMNLLGVPLSGPNVCGSKGRASRELCIRWHQAASFLPLLRNHADSQGEKQTPVDFDADALNILRSTLLRRYRYLPYMYTLFYEAHRSGSPVTRLLSYEFPDDKSVRGIEHQYLLGPALMISPVVHEGAISTEVYFPAAHWYDAHSGKLALDSTAGDNRLVSLLTPLPKLQVHLRGGYIIPTQQSLTTTTLSRRGAFTLLAALDKTQENASAVGELYIDDGDSLLAIEDHRYSLVSFEVSQNSSDTIEFKSSVKFRGYAGPEMQADLKEVRVYGVYGDGFAANSSMDATLVAPSGRSLRQHSMKADYFAQSGMLVLSRLDMSIGQEFHVKVVAQPEARKDGKPVDANTSGMSGSTENENDESASAKDSHVSKKSKFSMTGIVGIVVGCAFLAAIILVFLLRRRRHGYETI